MRERQKKLKRLWSWLLSSIWLTSAPLYGGMIFIRSLKPRPWSFDFFLAVPYDGPFTLLSIKRKETDQSRKLFLGPSDKLRGQKLFGHPFSGNFKALSQPFLKLFRRTWYRSLTSYRGNRSETQIPLTILLALPKRKEVTLSD